MLTEHSKVPSEQKKRDFFPAKNPVDARREVVPDILGIAGKLVSLQERFTHCNEG